MTATKQSETAMASARLSHENNFTLLRIFAATLVIWAHAYPLTGSTDVDLLEALTGRTFGWAAVSMFFAISGYLITQSLTRNSDLVRYAQARSLRVFPGLAVCILVTTVFLGVFVSTVPASQFFTSFQTLHYVIGNSTLLRVDYDLPGVFLHNPYPEAVNGSLWTLPKEVACYIAAAGLFGIGLARYRALTLAALLLLFTAYYALDVDSLRGRESEAVRLGFAFLLGAAYASMPVRLNLALVVGCLLVAVLALNTRFASMGLNLALAAATLWFAFAHTPRLNRLSKAIPDYSYGIYIYAFPAQQLVAMSAPELPVGFHFAAALVLTLGPAALSWHFIEKPALSLKDRVLIPAWQDVIAYRSRRS